MKLLIGPVELNTSRKRGENATPEEMFAKKKA
jgi:hypothetical protein